MTVCVDSSLLVSSYLSDSNSAEADRRRELSEVIWITPLNKSEFAHSIHQQVFRGRINLAEANRLWGVFENDCANGVWISTSFPDAVWRTCIELAQRHGSKLGMRTLDSLHVACALELRAERFWTFDERQAKLAEAVGLDIKA